LILCHRYTGPFRFFTVTAPVPIHHPLAPKPVWRRTYSTQPDLLAEFNGMGWYPKDWEGREGKAMRMGGIMEGMGKEVGMKKGGRSCAPSRRTTPAN